jgi:hypothetical protein
MHDPIVLPVMKDPIFMSDPLLNRITGTTHEFAEAFPPRNYGVIACFSLCSKQSLK